MDPPPETPVPESFDDWLYDPPTLPTGAAIPPWAWWVIAGIAALLIIYALFKLRARLIIPALPQDPRREALQAVGVLHKRAATLPPQEMGTGLVDAVNRYLHRRYGELAEFRTRDELFDPFSRPEGLPPLPPGVVDRFSHLMARCERMRFAGRESTVKARRGVIDATLEALEEEPA